MKSSRTFIRRDFLSSATSVVGCIGITCLLCIALCACSRSSQTVSAPSATADAAVTNTITAWSDLLPKDDVPIRRSFVRRSSRMDGLGDDTLGGLGSEFNPMGIDHSGGRAEQYGSFKTIVELDGRAVILRGYIVPLDFDDAGDIVDLLFVPFFGACIHVPPPPPNQVAYVHLAKPMKAPELGQGFELRGTLRTLRFDANVASAAYSVTDPRLAPAES